MKSIFSYESSLVSWCEENYQISINICEFMNTVTGLIYVYHAIYLYYKLKVLNGANFKIFNYRNLSDIEKNHINICIVKSLIGIFTMYFHGTLSYIGQILDEFSILLLIIALDSGNIRNMTNRILLGIVLLNLKSEYNRFFLAFYAISRSYKLFVDFYYDESIKRKRIFIYGLKLLIISVLVWLVDIFLCKYLYFSIHWLWHIFSSYALFYIINFCILTQTNNKVSKENYNNYLDIIYNL